MDPTASGTVRNPRPPSESEINTVLTGAPGVRPGTMRLADNTYISAPTGWTMLPPGDAALTRRTRAAGPHWNMEHKKGKRMQSAGLFAPEATINSIRAELETEREGDDYKQKLQAGRARRERAQQAYVENFQQSVEDFLAFHTRYRGQQQRLALAIAAHATPVGSGTVARTERIPIEKRAAAAVIAWMRHQTTLYDHMQIARVKGERRKVRRALAEGSRALLHSYRRGADIVPATCPLWRAIAALPES
jgi:hypothetical protein